jgi:hypothetical protein
MILNTNVNDSFKEIYLILKEKSELQITSPTTIDSSSVSKWSSFYHKNQYLIFLRSVHNLKRRYDTLTITVWHTK